METPVSKQKLFTATVALMYIVSLFWLLFAGYWLFQGTEYRYFYAISGFGYAVVLAMFTYYLNKKNRWAWWAATAMAGINIILTITDQIGWFDLAYLVPAIALFVMLLMVRKQLPKPTKKQQNP